MSAHRDPKPENVMEASPGQRALIDDVAEEVRRIEAIAVRASRLDHIRRGSNAAVALAAIRWQISRTLASLNCAERLGGKLEIEHGERWSAVRYVPPPAPVVDLAAYRARLAAESEKG